jgi:hypothetical protein
VCIEFAPSSGNTHSEMSIIFGRMINSINCSGVSSETYPIPDSSICQESIRQWTLISSTITRPPVLLQTILIGGKMLMAEKRDLRYAQNAGSELGSKSWELHRWRDTCSRYSLWQVSSGSGGGIMSISFTCSC